MVPASPVRRLTGRTLEAATRDFVSSLNAVIAAAVDTDARFAENLIAGGQMALIEASRSYGGYAAFPLVRSDENGAAPALLLRARYAVEMAVGREYLRVVTSSIGLWVDVTGGYKKHRPLVRLEYDRYPRAADRAAAHVHLHANSPEMARYTVQAASRRRTSTLGRDRSVCREGRRVRAGGPGVAPACRAGHLLLPGRRPRSLRRPSSRRSSGGGRWPY